MGRSSQVERTAARSYSRADPARSNSWSHSRAGPARSMVALTGRSSPVHPDRAGGVREAGRDQTDTPSGEGETTRAQQAGERHGTGRAVTTWPMQAGQRVRPGRRDSASPGPACPVLAQRGAGASLNLSLGPCFRMGGPPSGRSPDSADGTVRISPNARGKTAARDI